MVGFFNKDDEGNYGTAEKDGSANSDNTVKSNEQASGFEQTQDGQASGSMVGIDGLMDKRIKLEGSINPLCTSCRMSLRMLLLTIRKIHSH